MRVVVLSNVLPARRKTGGEIVTQNVLDALRAGGHDASILAYLRPQDPPPAPGEVCVGRRRIETREAGVRALGWGLRAVVAREPYTTAKWRSRGYARSVRDALAERPDAVIVDHAGLRVVAPLGEPLPFVFIAHNAESEMYGRLGEESGSRLGRWVNRRESARIREIEAELARRVEQVWTLTDADSDYFLRLHPGADVRKLEMASAFEPPAELPAAEYDVGVIGTWNWHANARGLRWFADEVAPLLPRELSVAVAGRGADWLAGRHPNVDVRGVVPDAQRFMSAARVVAVPSVTGGGIQIKTLDAIACGVPVVATEIATRGIDGLPGTVTVASDPAEFADALVAAAAADRSAAGSEATAWSNARRARFDAAVRDWLGELTGAEPQPVGIAERSAARPA